MQLMCNILLAIWMSWGEAETEGELSRISQKFVCPINHGLCYFNSGLMESSPENIYLQSHGVEASYNILARRSAIKCKYCEFPRSAYDSSTRMYTSKFPQTSRFAQHGVGGGGELWWSFGLRWNRFAEQWDEQPSWLKQTICLKHKRIEISWI